MDETEYITEKPDSKTDFFGVNGHYFLGVPKEYPESVRSCYSSLKSCTIDKRDTFLFVFLIVAVGGAVMIWVSDTLYMSISILNSDTDIDSPSMKD